MCYAYLTRAPVAEIFPIFAIQCIKNLEIFATSISLRSGESDILHFMIIFGKCAALPPYYCKMLYNSSQVELAFGRSSKIYGLYHFLLHYNTSPIAA